MSLKFVHIPTLFRLTTGCHMKNAPRRTLSLVLGDLINIQRRDSKIPLARLPALTLFSFYNI